MTRAWAAALRLHARGARAETSYQLARSLSNRGAPAIAGGAPEHGAIAIALRGKAVCYDCLANETGLGSAGVRETLARLSTLIRLTAERRPCSVCLAHTLVFEVA
jgi:hypothetical protein